MTARPGRAPTSRPRRGIPTRAFSRAGASSAITAPSPPRRRPSTRSGRTGATARAARTATRTSSPTSKSAASTSPNAGQLGLVGVVSSASLCFGGGCGGGVVPRAGQVKPLAPQRLGDRVAIGALTSAFPPELVDVVLAETGRCEQRRRLLPARMVVYYVLALALFADVAYLEVLRLLVEALRRPGRRHADPGGLPVKSALVQARARLGPEPLRALFAEAARPLATPDTQGAWYRGLRLVAGDGATLDVADTPANEAAFGRAKSGRGEGTGAFPQVRVVGLVEWAPTPRSRRRWGPTGPGRPRWPGGCWAGWSRGAWRGCCCWPTGCLSAPSCGAPRPPPARRCCGAPRPARPPPRCRWTRSLRTGRGCRGCMRPATGTSATRSWFGWSSTPSATPAR